MLAYPPTHHSEGGVSRPHVMAMDSGPGPAAYMLPGSTGLLLHDPSKKKWPGYSFGSRTKNGFKYDTR